MIFYKIISNPHHVKLRYENPPSSDSDPGPGGDMALSSEPGPVITRLQLYGLMTASGLDTGFGGFLLEKMTWMDIMMFYYKIIFFKIAHAQ